ncbi:hypothetical protein [Nonomuraea jabiensis]|uniref:hypothetical protein n=1 Tax=Nonomuraea jabiensis TaxID=882448 RepID=UPI0036C63CAA
MTTRRGHADAVCAPGIIANIDPVVAGTGLAGELDDLRIPTYGKRKWEVAASWRTAADCIRMLGRHVHLLRRPRPDQLAEIPTSGEVTQSAYDAGGIQGAEAP